MKCDYERYPFFCFIVYLLILVIVNNSRKKVTRLTLMSSFRRMTLKYDNYSLRGIFLILFSNIFFWYIKLPKDLSAKCYRNNKERLQKKLVKNIEVFLKKKKGNMVMNNVTLYQEVKNKNWLSIEKYKIRKKALFYLINYYRLEKIFFFFFFRVELGKMHRQV